MFCCFVGLMLMFCRILNIFLWVRLLLWSFGVRVVMMVVIIVLLIFRFCCCDVVCCCCWFVVICSI